MTTLKAIQTRYAGRRFRSRLEARWAVFFDTLGIRWEYESEGVSTPHGYYLPDFVLHLRRPVLFEVKPESALGETDPRWYGASSFFTMDLIVAYGMPRPGDDPMSGPGNGHLNVFTGRRDDMPYEGWDNYYAFCVCPACGQVGAEFEGRGARVCGSPSPHRSISGDKDRTYDAPAIVHAYRAALSARFEHGESG